MTEDSQQFQLFGICRIVLIGLLVFTHSSAWAEDGAQGKEIHIYIERQVLIAHEDGEEIYNFDIVTGRDGKETTAGTYEIFRKHEKYTSPVLWCRDALCHVFFRGRQGDPWHTDGDLAILSAYLYH